MKKIFIAAIVSLLASGVCIASEWYGFNDGMAQAQTAQKPVMLKFEAAGCSSCDELNVALRTPEVVARLEKFICIRIMSDKPKDRVVYKDLEMNVRDLMKLFQVHSRPALVFLRADGGVLGSFNGVIRKKQMLKILDAMIAAQPAAQERVLP